MHEIELRDKRTEEEKKKGSPTVGANCEVLIDGQPLKFVRSFKLEVDAAGIAKATIEMYGNFHANILGDYKQEFFEIKNPGEDNVSK
jgi:hypothetical protein